jgi:hypothetical protein
VRRGAREAKKGARRTDGGVQRARARENHHDPTRRTVAAAATGHAACDKRRVRAAEQRAARLSALAVPASCDAAVRRMCACSGVWRPCGVQGLHV